jgi:hypothetical protein
VLSDTFTASHLDVGRWDPFPYGGASASTGAGLQIALNGSTGLSTFRVFTFYQFTGDFDVQVDFNLGTGWNTSFPDSDSSPQLNGGSIGVYLDDPNWMRIFRGRFANAEGFVFHSRASGSPTSEFAASTASSGSLRVVSSAGTYHFFFDTGTGWTELGSAPA